VSSLQEVARFVRAVRRKMRAGEHSREPVKVLRVQWRADCVECDWLMRPGDRWDADLPPWLARENETLQALRDALDLHKAIFHAFRSVMKAELRMYRYDANGQLELMMTGSLTRTNEVLERVASIVMRARLCGFQFTLTSGVLQRPSGSC
jgi:hypothetical protein